MRILSLKMTPYSVNKASIMAMVEGDIDYNLSSAIIGKEYELIIREVKEKRSLTANAYYQVLLDKMVKALKTSREEIHRLMLQRYGVSKKVDDKPILFTLRADINPQLVCKYYDIIKAGEINGKQYIHYRVLKGSSEMDSSEFATLLDGVISECNELGIETMTPEEIKRLKYE